MELSKLKAPFEAKDIQWRVAQSGLRDGNPWAKVLAYVDNRAIMNRLDEVCGPMNWWNEYLQGPQGGVICGISIRDGDHVVTKWDGADNTNIEEVKGGLSDSMKRAAVQWGIGRYLYDLEEGWAVFNTNGQYSSQIKENPNDKGGRWFKWNPPALPAWALPKSAAPASQPGQPNELYPEYRARIAELAESVDGKHAWPKGVNEIVAWVCEKKLAKFSRWAEVQNCTDRERLEQMMKTIVEESARRINEAEPSNGKKRETVGAY